MSSSYVDDDVYDPNAEVLGELGAFEPQYEPRLVGILRSTIAVEETVFDAARRGDVPHLKRLIEIQGEAVNQYDAYDASPLYCELPRLQYGNKYLCERKRHTIPSFADCRRGALWTRPSVRVSSREGGPLPTRHLGWRALPLRCTL